MKFKDIVNSIKSLWNNITSINSKLEDTGWQTVTLNGEFKAYQDDEQQIPKYRKIGKVVEIYGVISPKATIEGSSTWHDICTLPEGFRPVDAVHTVCNGSSLNKWLLTVDSSGRVRFGRYGTNNYVDATDTVWLPFTIVYFVD